MQRKFGGEDFQIVSVVLGDSRESAIRNFLGGLKPNFVIVKPKDERAVADAFNIRYTPSNFVVGPDGVIKARPEAGYEEEEWRRDVFPHIPGAA